jgi:hypothetical protein
MNGTRHHSSIGWSYLAIALADVQPHNAPDIRGRIGEARDGIEGQSNSLSRGLSLGMGWE